MLESVSDQTALKLTPHDRRSELASREVGDPIFLIMTRIREETGKHASFRDAVAHAIGITATTVTSAAIALAGTFAVLGVTGGSSRAQQLRLSIAIGVLLDTFLVRTLLVPSIAILLGRWDWWPSASSAANTYS